MEHKFSIGDLVRANGREATLVGYDEGSDRIAYEVEERGGSTNTFYGHISSTELELLEAVAVETDETEAPVDPTPVVTLEELPLVEGVKFHQDDDESADALLAALATIDGSPELSVVPAPVDLGDDPDGDNS